MTVSEVKEVSKLIRKDYPIEKIARKMKRPTTGKMEYEIMSNPSLNWHYARYLKRLKGRMENRD